MNDATLFSGPRAKIARAGENLQGLELEFQRFSDSKPYELRQEHDLETDEFILVYYPVGVIPPDWSVVIGEILFNLRSALDLAVYELTVREQGHPLEKTEFPIFEDKAAFSMTKRNGDPAPMSGLYKIRGLSEKTIDCIETLQPYNTRKPDSEPVLSLLHEMNVIDKHRELHLCRQLALSTEVVAVRDMPNLIHLDLVLGPNLDERAVIARLKLAGGLDDKVYMDADVVIEIAFDERSATAFKKQEEVVKVLRTLIAGVEQILLRLENSVA